MKEAEKRDDTLETRAEKEAKKKVKLPVYHSNKKADEPVTIKFTVHPRKLERLFFIIIILVLVTLLVLQPEQIFRKCATGDESGSTLSAESAASELPPGS